MSQNALGSSTVPNSPDIQLKGANYGIRVVFPAEISEETLLEKFAAIPDRSFVMPMGTGVVLDFQSRTCSQELIEKILTEVLWPRNLKVLAWMGTDEETLARLEQAGFRTELPRADDSPDGGQVALLTHSLRSGQHEEVPGDVVLVGHLNHGAEIFAGGSIFVLGKLKGLVHAGRNGTDNVCVIAGSFEPLQVRIGDKLCTDLKEDMKWWKKPVIITVENDRVLIRELTFMVAGDRADRESSDSEGR